MTLAYVSYTEMFRCFEGVKEIWGFRKDTYAGNLALEHQLHDDLTSRGDGVLLVALDVASRRVKKLGSFRHGHTHNLVAFVSFLFKGLFERREEVARLVGKGLKRNEPWTACHPPLACCWKCQHRQR